MNTHVNTSASLYTWTQIIYGLHALSLLTGILGAATVIGAFLIAWLPFLIVGLWFVYRVVKGWMALSAHRPMYA